jgi:hypothetical protein
MNDFIIPVSQIIIKDDFHVWAKEEKKEKCIQQITGF